MASSYDDSSNANTAVDCPGCGKRYRWKPEAAGRKFKCGTCLERFRFPTKPGLPVETLPDKPTDASKPQAGSPPALHKSTPYAPIKNVTDTDSGGGDSDSDSDSGGGDSDSGGDDDGYELDLNTDNAFAPSHSESHTTPDDAEEDPYALSDELSMLPPPLIDGGGTGPGSTGTGTGTGGGTGTAAAAAAAAAATTEKCPSCGGRVKIGAVICINCGYNFKEGAKLKTEISTAPASAGGSSQDSEIPGPLLNRIKEREAADEDGQGDDRKRNFVAPLVAFIFGLLLIPLVSFLKADGSTTGLVVMLGYFGITIFIQVPFMIVGAFIVAKLAEVEFGPLGPAMLKLAAIALLPGLVGEILAVGFNSVLDIGGTIFGWMANLVITLGMLCYFFRFDLAESWSVVIAFAVLRFVITFLGGILLVLLFVP